jgi:hypothetical protein
MATFMPLYQFTYKKINVSMKLSKHDPYRVQDGLTNCPKTWYTGHLTFYDRKLLGSRPLGAEILKVFSNHRDAFSTRGGDFSIPRGAFSIHLGGFSIHRRAFSICWGTLFIRWGTFSPFTLRLCLFVLKLMHVHLNQSSEVSNRVICAVAKSIDDGFGLIWDPDLCYTSRRSDI